jgi:hypothetical protein
VDGAGRGGAVVVGRGRPREAGADGGLGQGRGAGGEPGPDRVGGGERGLQCGDRPGRGCEREHGTQVARPVRGQGRGRAAGRLTSWPTTHLQSPGPDRRGGDRDQRPTGPGVDVVAPNHRRQPGRSGDLGLPGRADPGRLRSQAAPGAWLAHSSRHSRFLGPRSGRVQPLPGAPRGRGGAVHRREDRHRRRPG